MEVKISVNYSIFSVTILPRALLTLISRSEDRILSVIGCRCRVSQIMVKYILRASKPSPCRCQQDGVFVRRLFLNADDRSPSVRVRSREKLRSFNREQPYL